MYSACHVFHLHMHAYSVMGKHFRYSPFMILRQYELFGENAECPARLSFQAPQTNL